VLERLLEECHRAVSDDGAEAVLLGCTCMAKTAPLLREHFSEVPLIESASCALAVVLDAVPARRKRTAIAGLVPQLVDSWLGAWPVSQLPAAEDCEVCVQLEDEAGLARA
jgi:hypothetical protein